MTINEVIRAGRLAQALKAIIKIEAEVEDEATGPLEVEQRRWPALEISFYGSDFARENGDQQNLGLIEIPLALGPRFVRVVRAELERVLEGIVGQGDGA